MRVNQLAHLVPGASERQRSHDWNSMGQAIARDDKAHGVQE